MTNKTSAEAAWCCFPIDSLIHMLEFMMKSLILCIISVLSLATTSYASPLRSSLLSRTSSSEERLKSACDTQRIVKFPRRGLEKLYPQTQSCNYLIRKQKELGIPEEMLGMSLTALDPQIVRWRRRQAADHFKNYTHNQRARWLKHEIPEPHG